MMDLGSNRGTDSTKQHLLQLERNERQFDVIEKALTRPETAQNEEALLALKALKQSFMEVSKFVRVSGSGTNEGGTSMFTVQDLDSVSYFKCVTEEEADAVLNQASSADSSQKMTIQPKRIKPFKCAHCGIYLKSKSESEEHKYVCNSRSTPMTSVDNDTSILGSKMQHTPSRKICKYICSICGRKFPLFIMFVQHNKSSEGLTQCSKSFKEKAMIYTTVEDNAEDTISDFEYNVTQARVKQEIIIDCEPSRPRRVQNHRTFGSQRAFMCDMCGKAFKTRAHLRSHTLRHDDSYFETCKICSAKFKSKSDLSTHLARQHGPPKFSCTLCSIKMKRKDQLELHMVNEHKKVTSHHCEDCGKYFTTLSSLVSHIDYQHGSKEKTLHCELCGKAFRHRVLLKSHLKVHVENKHREYSCGVCGKTFNREYFVLVHMAMKHNIGRENVEKKCSICDKVFQYPPAYARHMRFHETRRHQCTMCSRVFRL